MSNGKLIRNYIYNTLYQILAMVAPLITTPYISRVLGVTNISVFQYTQSIATYFILIGAVGTTLYGQREIAYCQDKPEQRTAVFWEIESFRIIITSLCTLVYYICFCRKGDYARVYTILIVEVLATAVDVSWLFMGMEDFRLTVIRNTIIKVLGIICVFIFVKGPNDLGIYTACMTFPILIGNLSLWFSLRKYLVKTRIQIKKLVTGIKKRIPQVLILFLPQVAIDVYTVLDKTMIGKLATDIDQVGYYSQAQKIVKIVLLVVTSLGTVMLPAMSAYFTKGDREGIVKSIKTAFRFIYLLSFALLFGMCAIAERFVPIFFGEGYDPVAPLIIVISPVLVIIATSNVIGKQFLLPTNQQNAFTVSILIGAGVNFVLNFVLIRIWNAIGASIATVLAELAVAAVQCWLVRKQLPVLECLKSGLRYCLFGAVMFFACIGVGKLLPEGKIWSIGVMIIVGMIIYLGELMISKDPMVKMGLGIVMKKIKH